MALSISPYQLNQATHASPSVNTPLQSHSTPMQFTRIVTSSSKLDHETLLKSQTKSPSLSPNFGHAVHSDILDKLSSSPPPSQPVHNLPSWTPLKRTAEDDSSSDSELEVDEFATNLKNATESIKIQPMRNIQATIEGIITAGRMPNSFLSPKKKKARFDGVFITTRRPSGKIVQSAQTKSWPTPASSALAFSLVDALAHTFDANRHTEDPSLLESRQGDDGSTGLQTDVETTEDERLQLNTRLAHSLLKRQREQETRRVIPHVSEINSEVGAPVSRPRPDRPIKRLKQIQYEANPALIDAALGTVLAPISWDAETDFIAKDDDFVAAIHAASADIRMTIDGDDFRPNPPENGSVAQPSRTLVKSGLQVPSLPPPRQEAVLSPYLSRGAKFRQRLDAIFGENATVRTDRVARPRPAELDFFTQLDESERQSSPSPSESTDSVSSASTTEEIPSAVPSTHITSQSPDFPPTGITVDQSDGEHPNETDSLAKAIFDGGEEQMNGWIMTLQRLIKGKVRMNEEALEALSIVLAEIESVKDSLNDNVSVTSELRESIKKISELYEIPFGDRNKLRQRAEQIFHTWSGTF